VAQVKATGSCAGKIGNLKSKDSSGIQTIYDFLCCDKSDLLVDNSGIWQSAGIVLWEAKIPTSKECQNRT